MTFAQRVINAYKRAEEYHKAWGIPEGIWQDDNILAVSTPEKTVITISYQRPKEGQSVNVLASVNPSSHKATRPWHPETLWDIRDVDLLNLPQSLKVDNTEGYVRQKAVLCGHPEDIREKMEGAFLHFPNVCFALNNLGGVVLYLSESSAEGAD